MRQYSFIDIPCRVWIAWVAVLVLGPASLRAQPVLTRQSNTISVDMRHVNTSRTPFVYGQVKLIDRDSTQSIEPGEEAVVCFTITNPTPQASQRLYVTASLEEPLRGLLVPDLIRLHPLDGGKKVEVRVPVQSTSELEPGMAALLIEIREADIFEADLIQIQLLTSGAVSAQDKR